MGGEKESHLGKSNTFGLATVETQYARYPKLDRNEVLKLQKWIQQQPHLPDITELEAIVFLHSCYNSMEAAKLCTDSYFTMRSHVKEFFAQRSVDLKSVKTAMETMMFVPLPGVTADNYKVIFVKVIHPDASKFVFADVTKVFSMVVDLWIMQEGIADGHIIAMDMDGVSLGHLARMNIMTMKKFMTYLQEAFPVRLKGLHYLNTVSFMDKFLAIVKPFMKSHLMDMLHLHTSVDTFAEFVPLEMLPNECGGQAGSLKALTDKQYKIVQENAGYFEIEEKRLVNELLRPGKPSLDTNSLGVDGNFKKLDFD